MTTERLDSFFGWLPWQPVPAELRYFPSGCGPLGSIAEASRPSLLGPDDQTPVYVIIPDPTAVGSQPCSYATAVLNAQVKDMHTHVWV